MAVNEQKKSGLPPAILLGGSANALSIARSLGRQGIRVFALNEPASPVCHSRFCRYIPLEHTEDLQKRWFDWLTGAGHQQFRGAVLLPCEDHGLELIARHRAVLKENYILIEADDEVLLSMLDKEKTYALARRAGVATPEIRPVDSLTDLVEILDQVNYPCALKPRHSHRFQKHFPGEKLFVIHNQDEMLRAYERVQQYGLEMLVTEIIPGPEDAYCSYFSYLDEKGEPLFHFTKRKLRQSPNGFGLGTYHLTDWNPEVAEMGLRFFRGAGLHGIANVEFKRDSRDGKLKLIECNARFTLVNELLNICGIDLSLFVYNRLTGRPLPSIDHYRTGVYLLRPIDDFGAFLVSRRRGELGFWQWIRSLMHRQHFLYFRWDDPWPAVFQGLWFFRKLKSPPLQPKSRGKFRL